MIITLDLPLNALKPNVRAHHRAKAAATKLYRTHACEQSWLACEEFDVKEPYRDAVVAITYYHATLAFADRDNILASLKAAWDGFTDAQLWPDDRDVIFLPVVRLKDAAKPRVEVRIYRHDPAAWRAYMDSISSQEMK